MATTFTMPDDLNTSNFLDKPGQYHFLVTKIDEAPTTRDGSRAIDGIRFDAQVLAGTDVSQVGRSLGFTLMHPNGSQRDGGKFCHLRQARMLVALGLVDLSARGQQVDIDWQHGIGRQFIGAVEARPNDDGKVYHDIAGAKIYALDDPETKHVPLDARAAALDPRGGNAMAMRGEAGQGEAGQQGQGVGQAGAGAPPSQPPAHNPPTTNGANGHGHGHHAPPTHVPGDSAPIAAPVANPNAWNF